MGYQDLLEHLIMLPSLREKNIDTSRQEQVNDEIAVKRKERIDHDPDRVRAMRVKAMAPDWAEKRNQEPLAVCTFARAKPWMADSIAVRFLSVVRTIPYATAFFQPLLQTRS